MNRWMLLGVVIFGSFLWWCIYKIAMWIQFLGTGVLA